MIRLPPELFLRAEPARFELRSVEERSMPPGRLRLVDHRPAAQRLTLMSAPLPESPRADAAARAAVSDMLLQFVRREAERFFPPLLRGLAREIGVPPPSRVRIGMPRTRWASRSSSGTISCNLTLMFLPRDLVLHVMLHELAHVSHMNHGPEFHALLSRLDPLSAAHAAALKTAVRNYVPAWAL